jgi:hypothetical protein
VAVLGGLAAFGVSGANFVPRVAPALASFLLLLFHRYAPRSFERKKLAVKMPRHPQKTGGLLPDTAAK